MRILAAATAAIAAMAVAASADAASFGVKNCSGSRITVQAYNNNDSMLWIASSEQSGERGTIVPASCSTTSCKLKVTYYNTSIGAVVLVPHVEPPNLYQDDRCTRDYSDKPLLPMSGCSC